jgi:hypothetical protein
MVAALTFDRGLGEVVVQRRQEGLDPRIGGALGNVDQILFRAAQHAHAGQCRLQLRAGHDVEIHLEVILLLEGRDRIDTAFRESHCAEVVLVKLRGKHQQVLVVGIRLAAEQQQGRDRDPQYASIHPRFLPCSDCWTFMR